MGTLAVTVFQEQDNSSMRVIAKRTLREFWERYPDSEQQLKAWHAEAEDAIWRTPADVKGKYGTASILRDRRVVFNICGNKYRLIGKNNYDFQIVYVRFVGTHTDYDLIDAETI
jgi:mRNA interferase HigB